MEFITYKVQKWRISINLITIISAVIIVVAILDFTDVVITRGRNPYVYSELREGVYIDTVISSDKLLGYTKDGEFYTSMAYHNAISGAQSQIFYVALNEWDGEYIQLEVADEYFSEFLPFTTGRGNEYHLQGLVFDWADGDDGEGVYYEFRRLLQQESLTEAEIEAMVSLEHRIMMTDFEEGYVYEYGELWRGVVGVIVGFLLLDLSTFKKMAPVEYDEY